LPFTGNNVVFYEVTGETSCHSYSLVPQFQNAVVLMRDCSSITVFLFSQPTMRNK